MKTTFLFIAIVFFFSSISLANETAAGIGASGIYFKDEKNISIEKEDLHISISQDKVEITYLFKNHSDKNITTIIAFPVPDYEYDLTAFGDQDSWRDFHDFTVEVNGQKTAYQVEARAWLNGKDYSQLITKMGISIKDFGERGRRTTFHSLFNKLTEKDKKTLIDRKLVLFEGGAAFPAWIVSLKYYWKQTFPANRTISIRHTYSPHNGYDVFSKKYHLKDACVTDEIAQWLRNSTYTKIQYVKYILVTANNWKQPIKNFHLIVDEPRLQNDPHWRMSICFDHKLTQTSYNRYEASITDYIPEKNLAAYLFIRMK